MIIFYKYSISGDHGHLFPWWKDVLKDRFLIEIGTSWQVGNGHQLDFG